MIFIRSVWRLGMGLVAIAAGVLWLAHPAQAATLSVSPSASSITVDQTVTITVRVNAAGQAINTSQATVTFPTGLLELKSISRSGSIFSFWAVEPNGSSSTGRITYSGGLPTPGYSGSGGTIFRATFQPKTTGRATISITGGKVLANDGLGTDVLTSQGSTAVVITTPAAKPTTPVTPPSTPGRPSLNVSSTTHSDQAAWYRQAQATVAWTRPSGLEAVSYGLTREADSVPDDIADANTGSTTVTLSSDGIWYFHIKGRYSSGWSAVTHFALRRDTTAPEPFSITIDRDRGTSDPTPQLSFTTKDVSSGIAKYTLGLDGDAAKDVTSPVGLTMTKAGPHTVIITAIDRAGNTQTAEATFTVEGYTAPVITDVSSPIMLLDSLVVKGMANAGDVVTVQVNGEEIGQVVAGKIDPTASGVTIRVPWIVTSDRLFRPGKYLVTAFATGPDQQVSVETDAVTLLVVGQSLQIAGHPVATIALAPVVAIGIALILLMNSFILFRLWLAVRALYRRETLAEAEIDILRREVARGNVSPAALETALYDIEQELEGKAMPVRPKRRRQFRR